jgi:hypothetical protein
MNDLRGISSNTLQVDKAKDYYGSNKFVKHFARRRCCWAQYCGPKWRRLVPPPDAESLRERGRGRWHTRCCRQRSIRRGRSGLLSGGCRRSVTVPSIQSWKDAEWGGGLSWIRSRVHPMPGCAHRCPDLRASGCSRPDLRAVEWDKGGRPAPAGDGG